MAAFYGDRLIFLLSILALLSHTFSLPNTTSPLIPTESSLDANDSSTSSISQLHSGPFTYNETRPFSVRIVGIFVTDSELPYTLELAKPAIDIAIEKAKRIYPLTHWEEAVFRNGSNHCTANLAGVFAAEEFYLRRVTVFIGPSCGLALDPVARMAAHWGIPVISSGGPHVQFQNKQIFSTLTRLSFSLQNLGSFVNQIFHVFNWTHVSIIVQERPSSPIIPLVKETIKDAFENNEHDIFVEIHEISRSLAKTNLKNLLLECAKEARIIFVLTNGFTLRQILLAAFELGMADGGYVFLTVELFKHENSFGNFDWFITGDSRNEDMKRMYESLFIITVHVPMTPAFEQFAEDVIHKSRNEFNTSFSNRDVNVILAGFHDSVILYGRAVTETILSGHDPSNGSEVTARIWNRTFSGYLSGDIFINANGDKETDYTLKDFNPDSLEMNSVMIFSGKDNQIVWTNLSAIHWPRGWQPSSDITVCHSSISDFHCSKKENNLFPILNIFILTLSICAIIGLFGYLIYRRLRLESELTSLWWKVRWSEIIFIHSQGSERSLDAAVNASIAGSCITTKPLYANFVNKTQETETTIMPTASTSGTVVEAAAVLAPVNVTTTSADGTRIKRPKPYIRINDYFALPAYLQNFSINRNGSSNQKQKQQGQQSQQLLSVSGPTSLAVNWDSSHQFPNPLCHSTGENSFTHQRNVSNESLAQIPNKGIYKGSKVFVKHLNVKHFTVNRDILLELKQLKDLAHDNLIRFVGICPEDQHVSILTEFCEKGNLRDLLDNEAIRIDWPFRYSLINDIVEGMSFIHESSLSFHGSLKSTNCVIDSRLVVKLTDFGLKTLRNFSKQNSAVPTNYKSLLWTAPEHLRQRKPELHGSERGDVYSFAIVLQEIITRSGPFETVKVVGGDGKYSVVSLDPQFIIQQLKLGGATPYRPNVDQHECLPELTELITQCWEENPANRPTFPTVRGSIGKIVKDYVGGSGNSFLENLLLRLEQYANDLEVLVEQKTSAFFEEKRKCEELLYELLPRTVADQLKRANPVKPESFQCVTIFFSDIVKFTQIAAQSTPMEIVDFLNDLYTLFDSIIANYDVYKVETVGDAYMVVSGLPVRNGNEHARQISRMSLELLHRIGQFRIKHLPGVDVKLRIGIHSGSVAAGVIGLKMPRYCLFGDAVNTASRMESHGEANKIHISDATKHILEKFHTFNISLRGDIYLKGKGIVRTYWLDSETTRFRFLNSKHLQQRQVFAQPLRTNTSLGIEMKGMENTLSNVNVQEDDITDTLTTMSNPEKLSMSIEDDALCCLSDIPSTIISTGDHTSI